MINPRVFSTAFIIITEVIAFWDDKFDTTACYSRVMHATMDL
ncbi:hypothetical protein [Candidatus Lokiarchaeum ossiferum]